MPYKEKIVTIFTLQQHIARRSPMDHTCASSPHEQQFFKTAFVFRENFCPQQSQMVDPLSAMKK